MQTRQGGLTNQGGVACLMEWDGCLLCISSSVQEIDQHVMSNKPPMFTCSTFQSTVDFLHLQLQCLFLSLHPLSSTENDRQFLASHFLYYSVFPFFQLCNHWSLCFFGWFSWNIWASFQSPTPLSQSFFLFPFLFFSLSSLSFYLLLSFIQFFLFSLPLLFYISETSISFLSLFVTLFLSIYLSICPGFTAMITNSVKQIWD